MKSYLIKYFRWNKDTKKYDFLGSTNVFHHKDSNVCLAAKAFRQAPAGCKGADRITCN